MALSPLLREVSFDDLPGWRDDDKSPAFDAFRRSALHVLTKPYRTRRARRRFRSALPKPMRRRARVAVDRGRRKRFFEAHFVRCAFDPTRAEGFVTGFYEPEVDASPVRTDRFTVPLLSRPADLVDIDDANRPAGWIPISPSAAHADAGIVEYFDRAAIEQGALAGRGLELAWLEDKVDAFFIHVQGAARLRHDRRLDAPHHLCREVRPSLHRPRPHPGRARRDPAGRRDDAVDPRLVPATIPIGSTKSSGRTAPTSSSATRRSTIRRLARSPRQRCR